MAVTSVAALACVAYPKHKKMAQTNNAIRPKNLTEPFFILTLSISPSYKKSVISPKYLLWLS
jgi:hypothetical protein